MSSEAPFGFRLRDLMTATLVVALALAIGIPECNNRHIGGRRTQCQNNMRQIGLGLLGYSNATGVFPNSGTFADDPKIHGGDPSRSNIHKAVIDPESLKLPGTVMLYSWVVDILPYIDNQELYNAWNFQQDYLSAASSNSGMPNNLQISSTAIGILRCQDDNTAQPNQGNLSYVVNTGFTRWPAIPTSWVGSATDGQSRNGEPLRWSPPGDDWKADLSVGRKLGVMFPASSSGDHPWNISTSPSAITDGASQTLLVGENTLVGFSEGSIYSGGRMTNWACPLPNFTSFLGSDNICHSGQVPTECLGGQLSPGKNGTDGPGWSQANHPGSFEEINFGQHLTVEGSFPFANSPHAGGSNFVFCDGAVRFLPNTIDGTIYSKILTPAGLSLPKAIRPSPIDAKAHPLD